MKNPIKPQLLKFIRYFYNDSLQYADQAIEKWFKAFVFWLVLLSLIYIFPISGINLGPGAWHLINILQLGLILWFIEGLYKYIMGGWKK